jgi:hypothetical protein
LLRKFSRDDGMPYFSADITVSLNLTLLHVLVVTPRMSIKGVKYMEDRKSSLVHSGHYRENYLTRPFDHVFIAHSTLKAHTGGITSSTSARDFYIDLGAKKRERMIAKIKSESKEQ